MNLDSPAPANHCHLEIFWMTLPISGIAMVVCLVQAAPGDTLLGVMCQSSLTLLRLMFRASAWPLGPAPKRSSSCSSSEQVHMAALTLSAHDQASGHLQWDRHVLIPLHMPGVPQLRWPCSKEEQQFLLFGAGPSECAGPKCACPEFWIYAAGQRCSKPTAHARTSGHAHMRIGVGGWCTYPTPGNVHPCTTPAANDSALLQLCIGCVCVWNNYS